MFNELIYKLKRKLYKPYNVIKARDLPYTYSYANQRLSHFMFEVLSSFLKVECDIQSDGSAGPKCYCDWYAESAPLKLSVNGKTKWALDEMWELYYWWHHEWIPFVKNKHPIDMILWELISKYMPDIDFIPVDGEKYSILDISYRKYGDKVLYDKYSKRQHEFSEEMDNKLKEMMIRLVKVSDFMLD